MVLQTPGAYKVAKIKTVIHTRENLGVGKKTLGANPLFICRGATTDLAGFVKKTLRANCIPYRGQEGVNWPWNDYLHRTNPR